MKLSFVFLCLSLATLSLAAIPSVEEEHSLSSSKKVEKDDGTPSPTGKSSQATKKKPIKGGKSVPKKHSRVGATKGVASASADEMSPAGRGSGKDSQEGSAALDFFPKVLVELIGEYLEGFFVVFTRDWSAVESWCSVAVDSERHYLITPQYIQASSHGDSKQVSLGSPELSYYSGFQSSHDGRYLFFAGKTKEQVSSDSLEKTARWLVQDTGTKSLKNVALEGDEASFVGNKFMLSANGKTLVSTLFNSALDTTGTASVYQIEEHGTAASASKNGDITGSAIAVSGNGNCLLVMCWKKGQLEMHDVSGNESLLVLKINYAGTTGVRTCALNNDGNKAAFIDNMRRLYIVDVSKEEGSISVKQLTKIAIPDSVPSHSLIYDAKDRLYVFEDGGLWLVDPSKREFISLEETQVPQGYGTWSSAISPNADYIVLLFRSTKKNKEGERHFQMIVKRNTKDVVMRLCGYES